MTNDPDPIDDTPPIDPWDSPEGDAVRADRTTRLASTDWMVLPDSPRQSSLHRRAHLWLYRAALRNITDLYNTPAGVIWPILDE
jgi:hypothetical protein